MKLASVIIVLVGIGSNALAAGSVECKSRDSNISLSGSDDGFDVTVTSVVSYGTELLSKNRSAKVGQVYNSDRMFNVKIVDGKSGFEILNLETAKSPDILSGVGFVSGGLAFIAGAKNVVPVTCVFKF